MYEIKWTSYAFKRYMHIIQYWIKHNQSSEYSLKIIEEVERMETLLKHNPYVGSVITQTKENIRRVIILKNFSIFYKIKNDIVQIIFFFDNRDNPKKLTFIE